MNKHPIVFALSNPDPEITYDEAMQGGATIYASGRSDLPNQINNLLAFPGVLRGALDARIENITTHHKLAAAKALADYVSSPRPDHLLPDPLDKQVASTVAQAIISGKP
jgi:malate dehydrogenase (oxaloacetate-decarboxylating)